MLRGVRPAGTTEAFVDDSRRQGRGASDGTGLAPRACGQFSAPMRPMRLVGPSPADPDRGAAVGHESFVPAGRRGSYVSDLGPDPVSLASALTALSFPEVVARQTSLAIS